MLGSIVCSALSGTLVLDRCRCAPAPAVQALASYKTKHEPAASPGSGGDSFKTLCHPFSTMVGWFCLAGEDKLWELFFYHLFLILERAR